MRTRFSFIALLIALSSLGQAPQRMSFQAVLRDNADALIVNGAVGLRISVLQGSANGTAVFVETHSAVTNSNGLVSLEIGGGTVQSGSIAAVDWANGPFFLKTETDPGGGTIYSITGTTQLLSVPYALHAANNMQGPAGPQGAQGPAGPPGEGACQVIRTGDGRVVLYNESTAYGFGRNLTSGSGWYARALDGPVVAAYASDSAIVLHTASTGYGFGMNSTSGSGWYMQALTGSVIGAAHGSGRIVLYTATNGYGFGYNSTSGSGWYNALLSGAPVGHVEAGNRIVVYTGAGAHGFGYNSTSGSGWYSQTYAVEPIGTLGTR